MEHECPQYRWHSGNWTDCSSFWCVPRRRNARTRAHLFPPAPSAVPCRSISPKRVCMLMLRCIDCSHGCHFFLLLLLKNFCSSSFLFFFPLQRCWQPDEPDHLPQPEARPEHPLLVHRRRPVLLRAVRRRRSHAPGDAHVHPPCRAVLGQRRQNQEWALRRRGG